MMNNSEDLLQLNMKQGCKEDSLSGINYDWINALVFNFFPFTTHGYMSNADELTYTKGLFKEAYLQVGSIAENLNLGQLVNKITHEMEYPDMDNMGCYNEHILDDDDNKVLLQVAQDDRSPLHCTVEKYSRVSSDFLGCVNGKELVTNIFENSQWKHLETICGVNTKLTFDKAGHYTDQIPCLSVKCPRFVMNNLKTRFKKLPECSSLPGLTNVVEILQRDGIHVVYKPHVYSKDPDHQFRFSFSVIEKELALSLNDTQRTAYRVLKGLVKSEINDKAASDEEKLPSYLLKTTLFWVCENLPRGLCTVGNIGKFFYTLLDRLIHGISDGWISQFFVPEGNLLENYRAETLKFWMEGLHRIRYNTMEVMIDFWNKYDTIITGVTDLLIHHVSDCIKIELVSGISAASEFRTRMIRLNAMDFNLTDIMRLLLTFGDLYCCCDNRIITDFDERCLKCMTEAFCFITSQAPDQFCPYLVPDTANMWYIRSLYDTEKKEMYDKSADEFFKVARRKLKSCYTNIHYALYLTAKKKYEKAVSVILDGMAAHSTELFFLPCFFTEMLDKVLQLKMSGKCHISFVESTFLYHLLLSCYNKAGIFAEVTWPSLNFTQPMYEDMPNFAADISFLNYTIHRLSCFQMGDQYFLKQDYFQAAEWYKAQNEMGQFFLACIANMFNEEHIEQTLHIIQEKCQQKGQPQKKD